MTALMRRTLACGALCMSISSDPYVQGENVPGKYNELFEKAIAKHGLERCVHMPFPVSGRLVYTVAGLKRYA